MTAFMGFAVSQSVQFVEDNTVRSEILRYRSKNVSQQEIQGFRIQFYYTDDRRQMEQALGKVQSNFPSYNAKWKQKTPFYYISGGAFDSKLTAMQALQQVRSLFPGAIIIEDMIAKQDLTVPNY